MALLTEFRHFLFFPVTNDLIGRRPSAPPQLWRRCTGNRCEFSGDLWECAGFKGQTDGPTMVRVTVWRPVGSRALVTMVTTFLLSGDLLILTGQVTNQLQ